MTTNGAIDLAQNAAVAHTNAVLKRARTIYYALVVGNIYSLIGLIGLRDVDFFAGEKSVRLPLFPADVPTLLFCSVAPSLLLLTYLYQHYYLRDLFERLDALPVRRRDGTIISNLIDPWVLSRRAICKRNSKPGRWLNTGRLDRSVFTASYFLATLLTPSTLILFWLWTFAPHNLKLSAWLLSLLMASIISFLVNFKMNYLSGNCSLFKYRQVHTIIVIIFIMAGSVGTGIFTIGKVNGWSDKNVTLSSLAPLYSADLSGAQLVKQPTNWRSRKSAILQFLKSNFDIEFSSKNIGCMTEKVKRPVWCADKNGLTHVQWDTAVEAFRDERFAYLLSLPRIDLKNFDLRGANLTDAFLANVDAAETNFSGAIMKRVVLEGAQLPRANLSNANLTFADISNADISSVNLVAAAIYGADFTDFIMHRHIKGMRNQQVFNYAYGDVATKIHSDRVQNFNHSTPSHWSDQTLKEGDYDSWYLNWLENQTKLIETGKKLMAQKKK